MSVRIGQALRGVLHDERPLSKAIVTTTSADIRTPDMTSGAVTIQRFNDDDLRRVADVHRTEQTDIIFAQRGAELEPRRDDWSARPSNRHSMSQPDAVTLALAA